MNEEGTNMKRSGFIISLIVAVILGSAIGGALAGGVAIGKSQGRTEARQGLLSQFGQSSSTTGQGNTQSQGNNTIFSSGLGTVGTVEKIEGNVITLRTTTGTVTVNIANSTLIQKTQQGSLADISTGESITVSGSENADGSIEARRIIITPGFTLPSFRGAGQSQ
jgi:predicted acylesterase/phospholipase RssA